MGMKTDRGDERKPWRTYLPFLILGGMGVATGVFLGVSDQDPAQLLHGSLIAGAVILLFLLFISMFLAIHIHELGHLLVGKLLGFRLHSFRVVMFAWQMENGRLRFALIPNRGYGGLCAMIPVRRTDQRAFAYYALGGILLNSVTGAGALLLLLFREGWSDIMTLLLAIFGVLSLALACLNLLPFLSAGQPTDGMIFFSILRKRPLAKKLHRNSLASQMLLGGIRPRDMALPPLEGEEALDFQDLQYLLLRYFQAMDGGEETERIRLLERMEAHLSVVPDLGTPPFHYEMAQHHAMEGNGNRAWHHVAAAGPILTRDLDLNGLRVKAHLAWYLEGDGAKALQLVEKARTVRDGFPFPGQAKMEEDLLHALEDTLRKEHALP